MTKLPHLIWITLESVRADHTTVGGYRRDTTPNLRAIAEEDDATRFSRCFSQSIWTPPSSASILTGTYMSTHKLGREGSAERRVRRDLATLPEVFGEAGYRTGCFSPNAYLSPATGLDRGFDEFVWLTMDRVLDVGVTPILKYLLKLGSHGPGLTLDTRCHNLSFMLTEALKNWLAAGEDADGPSFSYLHLGNPHHPYLPPRGWRDRFTDDIAFSAAEAMALSYSVYESKETIKRTIANGCDLSVDEFAAIEAMYDAEIAYADDRIGHLFEYARSAFEGDVVFVVTADHGECFGERNVLGHNLVVNDTLTHVPLVIHGLNDLAVETSDIVQHVDVSKTLAGLVDVNTDQFQGVDLREETPRGALSQLGVSHYEPYLEHNSDFDIDAYHKRPVSSLRTEEYRYVRSEDQVELFELPDEETDVATERPDVTDELDDHIDELGGWRNSTDVSAERAEFSVEMRQQLEELGYL